MRFPGCTDGTSRLTHGLRLDRRAGEFDFRRARTVPGIIPWIDERRGAIEGPLQSTTMCFTGWNGLLMTVAHTLRVAAGRIEDLPSGNRPLMEFVYRNPSRNLSAFDPDSLVDREPTPVRGHRPPWLPSGVRAHSSISFLLIMATNGENLESRGPGGKSEPVPRSARARQETGAVRFEFRR